MALDYTKCAQEIFNCLGGRDNLVSAAHCATRLRLVTVDNSKIDLETLENVDGVKGVFSASGQLQIILGTGTVNKVYDQFIPISGVTAASKEEVKAAAAANQNIFKRAIKTLGDIFVPIIPAIVASGFLMGIMEALNFMVNNGFLNIDTSGSIYVFANLFSNTAYVFLPILIAYSAAKAFGGNPYLGAVIGMLMIHPDLQNAWTVATDGVLKTQPVWFGLYSVDLVGYQGHVIPVIIAVWVMCFIEKRLHKIVPAMFDLFVTPLLSVFITGYLTYSIIGPIFVTIENAIIGGIQILLTLPFGIGSMLMGGLYSLTVVAGVHHMYTVIDVGQLAKHNFTYWLPLASAANMAQGAATLAVALKSKNQKTKSMALPSAFSCFMGITEPAIFGVNLRMLKPFICGAIGGAAGAMYASLVGLGASGTGVTGLFGLLLCLHDPINYIIMAAVSIGVSFALTWVFWKEDAPKTAKATAGSDSSSGSAAPALSAIECKPGTVYAPVSGTAIPSEEIPDDTFATGVLGQGVGIQPNEGIVVAPFDGEISSVTDTQHAVGVSSPNGMELLIHVGVDTVAMQGDGFQCFVEEGQQVKAGDKLIAFDRQKIAAAGHPDVVVVLVTNSDDYKEVASAMDGKRVVIRTLDIGADKQVDYFNLQKEENPALGVRAIRICLNRPEVFRTQLRALYRASAYGKVAIMFPMITSIWEVKECKRACQKVMAELDAEGIPYRRDTEIGIMIETPASVFVAEELAKEVDFFSVGTNDLTQYTLACDRQANDLGKFFDPHHPAVLRALKIATDAAHKAGIWIGICGELGADLSLLETFLAIGIDELSVSPSAVLPLRAMIRQSIAKTCTLERLEC